MTILDCECKGAYGDPHEKGCALASVGRDFDLNKRSETVARLPDGSTAANVYEAFERGRDAAMAGASIVPHSHYFKPCPYPFIDIYRILVMYQANHPCQQHAIKKLLLPGDRGAKDLDKDIQEVIDTMKRWQAMRAEEAAVRVERQGRVPSSELK